MKKLVLALVVMALLGSFGAAQYHNPTFLMGGYYASTSTYYMPGGLYKVDAAAQTFTSLYPAWAKPYYSYQATMDADNKNIVFSANGTSSTTYNIKSGIFRFDPTTQSFTTIVPSNYGSNGPMYYQYRLHVDQNGDYMFGAYGRKQVTVPTTTTKYDYHILKYDASNTLSTVFTSYMLNNQYARCYFSGNAMGADIDTGNILVNQGTGTSSTLSPFGYYTWFGLDPNVNGKWSTFSSGVYGTYYGRNQSYGRVQQDYATGDITDSYYQAVYVQKPGYGMGGYTTLWNWGYPGGWSWRYTGVRDLQSAPMQRIAHLGYFRKTQGTSYSYAPALAYKFASPPFGAQMVDLDPTNSIQQRYGFTYSGYVLDWWQGRNIQTVKTGANKWQVRYSCPNYAGKNYFAVLGSSGVRPGIPLPSGRTIWINFDALVFLSLNNILLPFWSSGPGVLDANGEAQGFLNTTLIAPLNGLTVHIAMIVMDATAPDGIAYIPDTYVMKLP